MVASRHCPAPNASIEVPLRALMLVVELYGVVTVIDVLLAWVQPEPGRVPRVLTHVLTEPVQRPIRRACARLPLGGWDVAPLVVLAVLAMLRVWMLRS